MKKNRNKRSPLFFPVLMGYLILLLAVLVYGTVRFFLLRGDGETTETVFRLLWEIVPALGAVLLIGLFLLIALSRRVTLPLRRALRVTGKLSERVEKGQPPETVEAHGDLGDLLETVAAQEKKLAELLKKRETKTAEETDRKVRSELAREFLRGTIPDKTAFGGLTYGVSAEIRRSGYAGADLFDGFLLDKNRVYFAVGDIWGTGISAALFATRLKSALREQILAAKTPAAALSAVNDILLGCNPDTLAATLFVGIFHPDTGELRYANAGHLSPVVVGEKIGFLRMRAGTPLGIYPGAVFQDEFILLRPGQGVFLHTDGLVNARNDKHEFFGYDRLIRALKGLYENALGAESVTGGILKSLGAFCGECAQKDDLTVFALYYPSGVQQLFRPDLSEANRLRDLIGEWMGDDPRKNKIALACSDIFTNIVNHAGAKCIRLGCERTDDGIVLRFTDDGEPFDPLQPTEDKDLYSFNEEEMGITIIRRLGGEMFYRTKQSLNILTLRFPLIKGL